MLRALALSLALFAPLPALAQESLADIRTDLATLAGLLGQLRAELASTGASGAGTVAGTALERMNALEAELARLTAKTEALEQRIGRIVSDGTNRIGDLEFRVCEMEDSCDIASLGETKPLGGAVPGGPAVTPPPASGGTEMALGEKADYDRAKEALDSGSFRSAADLFAAFAETYPGSPLTGEAAFLRGEALMALGETGNAARAWLESFYSAPEGPRAPDALLKLGLALDTLGQRQESCLTLGQVPVRFPGSAAAAEASAALTRMACG